MLWAIRTTPCRATGETPFYLTYGAEAVLPSEITLGSPRVHHYSESAQQQQRAEDVNLLEEARCKASLRNARYQQGLRRYHERHVRSRALEVGDLVLRRIQNRVGLNKLSPMWEGPYVVTRVTRPGSVKLATEDGRQIPNAWNIEHLRKFYP